MYNIEMEPVSEAFSQCWRAAGRHIGDKALKEDFAWHKADLHPPFLEHLSFRIGNQLYFVRVEDVDGTLNTPGNLQGVQSIARDCKGHACIMPMRQTRDDWQIANSGWGLISAETRSPIDPTSEVTDDKIEMTDWELHEFAVQVIRDYVVKKLGRKLMSSHGNPSVNPSLWFVGDTGPEWVVVRAVRYPENDARRPLNMAAIAAHCAKLSGTGHFASVAYANAGDPFDPKSTKSPMPLWRGDGMYASFQGLEPAFES
jgi:hypothetical protein